MHIRMLKALAFLPAGDVIEGFQELADTIRILYDKKTDDSLQYLEDTYTWVDIVEMHQNALHILLLTLEHAQQN